MNSLKNWLKPAQDRVTDFWDKLVESTESFHGRKLGILIASSMVATSLIVVGAFTATGNDPLSGPLAGLLGQSFAADPGASDGTTTDDAADPTTADTGGDGGPTSLPPPAADKTAPASSSSTDTSTDTTPDTSTDTTPDNTDDTDNTDNTDDDGTDDGNTDNTDDTPKAGRVKHVFVVNLTSPGYDRTFGDESQMPYLKDTLSTSGELLTNYSLLDDDEVPNNVAMFSGQPPNSVTEDGCGAYKEFPAKVTYSKDGTVSGTGCVYPYDVNTFVGQLTAASFTWHGYEEDMADQFGPGNCVHPDLNEVVTPEKGGYAPQGNPFIYFRSLLDLGDCAGSDYPLTQLKKDLASAKKTPNYSYISPNLCHSGVVGQCPDGSPDGPAAADDYLKTLIPQIQKSAAYKKDGLIMITFGDVDAPDGTADPNKVGAVLLSPFVSTNTKSGAKLDPYSILKTNEDLFGLDHLVKADSKSTKSLAAPLLGNVGGD